MNTKSRPLDAWPASARVPDAATRAALSRCSSDPCPSPLAPLTPGRGRGSILRYSALAIALAAAMMSGAAVAQPQDGPKLAPVINQDLPNAIPGQYIVVFKGETSRFQRGATQERIAQLRVAQERVKALGGEVLRTYQSALVGFSVRLPREPERAKAALDYLRSLPEVAFIEQDQEGRFNILQPPTPPGAPPTGLDRIDRRLLPLNGTYSYSETGAGVNAYVIDSGMRITHTEFSGRAVNAFTVAAGDFTDCAPHGTHVAGTIGGETFGVAKDVNLFNVRVGSAGGCIPTAANVIAGVDWVTANRVLPAVANLSLTVGPSAATDLAVNNSIAAGVFYAAAAGNGGVDACGTSPARIPAVMTVGATRSDNDARAIFGGGQSSSFGPCLDIFAPGLNILSSWNTNDNATNTISGTSMASPHVAGVAARWLQNHPAATPAAVTTAILNVANTAATAGWGGITDPGAGSPNVLLHYGSLDDGATDGDPHIRTTDGVHYDFQSAGEFTLLRDGNGLEIQTRQTPVSTQPPIANAHTGLAACVSLNEAVASRVAGRRVTYQPENRRMVLRIDGVVTPVTAQGVVLGQGARVAATGAGNGIAIDFPDGTGLTATSHFWGAPHNRWYLNVSVLQTPASEGVMGDLAPGSWLPALPDGTSLGPKPVSEAQRFADLYQTFADAWRVTDATSLFDYAAGESAATFALKERPPKSGSCVIPEAPLAEPMAREEAVRVCSGVRDKNRNANCVFDVAITGHAGFAKAYLLSERIEAGATKTDLNVDGDRLPYGAPATIVATVSRRAKGGEGSPAGSVRFFVDGKAASRSTRLDANGRAQITIPRLAPGRHRIEARFAPPRSSRDLPSADEAFVVVGDEKSELDQRRDMR